MEIATANHGPQTFGPKIAAKFPNLVKKLSPGNKPLSKGAQRFLAEFHTGTAAATESSGSGATSNSAGETL